MTRKKMILRLLFLLCALALTTSAYPIWGGINSVDVAGNTCPAITSLNVKCPLLCVSGDPILHCPAAVSVFVLPEPSADNPCDCSQAQPSAYHPCSSGLRVNLTSYLQSNKTAVTQQACAQALAVDMGAYGDATGRPFFVSSCPAGVTKTWTYKEPGWLGTWAGLGALIGLLVVWHGYKRFRERRYQSAPTHTSHANDSYSTSSKDTLKAQADSIELAPFKTSLDSNRSLVSSTDSVTPLDAAANIMDPRRGDAERLVVKGYVDDAFGTAVLGVVIAVSFGWMLCLAVITADYYGAFTGMPFGLFLGDATLSLQAFMGVFYGAAAWLLGPPSVAQYIQVEKHLDTIVMLDKDGSGMLRWLRRCEDRLTRAFGNHDHDRAADPLLRLPLHTARFRPYASVLRAVHIRPGPEFTGTRGGADKRRGRAQDRAAGTEFH
ncbi:hypothetical protein BC938DRAFT_481503 [Jimgerdemannia flammicorona]|uniref:Uncharacterized protein n=1 Tax=Jimgerdemannia flammicorona TaxID=994334 RepID=A0A433QG09_9FUNG|nr:hypothetical protein BC938DRAFT_481503 [Jimgerdemannia flammicorona]